MNSNETNKNSKTKKKRTLFKKIFIWSLFIHLLILLILLFFAFKPKKFHLKTASKIKAPGTTIFFSEKPKQFKDLQKKLEEAKKQEEQKKEQEKNELPASLKPRKSVFGTAPEFAQSPEFKAEESEEGYVTPLMEEGVAPEKAGASLQQIEKQQEIVAQKAQEKVEVKHEEIKEAEKEALKKPEKQKLPGKGTLAELEEIKKEKKEIANKVQQKIEISKATPETEQEKAEIQKRIEQIAQKQEMLQNAQQAGKAVRVKLPKIRNIGDAKQDRGPIQPSGKKSIIAMTRGYLENLKDEGSDWLERKGDDNKRPSLEELKYISYEEKINWQLQNSWKENFEFKPYQKLMEGKSVLEFTILENGSVQNIRLLESSGIPELDSIIIKSVEFAAPFPPLPKHFGTTTYTTGRIITVSARNLNF